MCLDGDGHALIPALQLCTTASIVSLCPRFSAVCVIGDKNAFGVLPRSGIESAQAMHASGALSSLNK